MIEERKCPFCDTRQSFEVEQSVGGIKGCDLVRCVNPRCNKQFFVMVNGEIVAGPHPGKNSQ
jgi:hypothetical protein